MGTVDSHVWGSGQESPAKGLMLLLMFGIPVIVWLRWREQKTGARADTDLDRRILRRSFTPPPKLPAAAPDHDVVEPYDLVGCD